jgi:Tol biopolymer transport system component
MRRICLYITLIITLFAISSPVSGQMVVRYLYTVSGDNGTIILRSVDPSAATTAEDILTLAIPQSMGVSSLTLSPDDDWLAITFRQLGRPDVTLVRLVNIQTSETRDINQVSVAFFDTTDTFAPKVDTVWSPNSRYLAFLSIQDPLGLNLVVPNIYDLQSGQFVALATTTANRTQIVWSRDSAKIAFLSENCSYDVCSYTIDIYSMGT